MQDQQSDGPDPTAGKTTNVSTDKLPVLAYRAQIAAAVRDNPVVIISGETGSGKTTQIPRICLEAGLCRNGVIACTQPRRVAAVAVAERVAQELSDAGSPVGWQHRFARHIPRNMRIKFMTDGILLAEIKADPMLRRYGIVMVDEAHERTLNIDFILGCLKRIRQSRTDLKIIVSSATLETERFSTFFDGAPVITIPGRTYPVEVRYRDAGEDADLTEAVSAAVSEVLEEPQNGDVLVFLPGERDIRSCKETLEGRNFENCVVLPLMAALPATEQRRVFHVIPGKRRIILSTNVAETSVTIPGIRYVIDSGLARISRYNHRAHVKRLHIEPVSQASAEQRKGRCGRIGPGVCIRLYSEEDLQKRPQHTEPEVRRTSLAGLILSMSDWRLGSLEDFPFILPPAASMIREGYKELLELKAIREIDTDSPGRAYAITQLGRDIVKLPLEPRLSRMLLAAADEGTMRDALTVVSALSCEDPLSRPVDKSDEADKCHAKFKSDTSDFNGILMLWRFFHDTQFSRTALRRRCQDNFVSYRKLCEWEDVRSQLESMLKSSGIDTGSIRTDAGVALHKALLAGLISGIGMLDPEERDYKGANGKRFSIFPGSGLFKKPPKWMMCAELVDTSRLYARRAASIDPNWIEPAARHLCKYSYHSEYWDAQFGTARALRRVTLYGLLISDGDRVDISRIAPEQCRDMFLRHGLVEGELPAPVPQFVKRNLEFIGKYTAASHKTRTALPEEDAGMFASLYSERIPESCCNLPALRKWLAHAKPAELERLIFTEADIGITHADSAEFPDAAVIGGCRMRLSYRHAPGADDDGITCMVAMQNIPLLRLWHSDWLVPGSLQEKIVFMLRLLTRATQAEIAAALGGGMKARDTDAIAEACLSLMERDMPLAVSLSRALCRTCHIRVNPELWRDSALPPQFSIRWNIVDSRRSTVFVSRSKAEAADFYAELKKLAPESIAGSATPAFDSMRFTEIFGLTSLDFPDIPKCIEIGTVHSPLYAFPALHDDGGSASIRLFPTQAEADASHVDGLLRLVMIADKLRAPAAPKTGGKRKQNTTRHSSLQYLSIESIPVETHADSPVPPQPDMQADILRAALVASYASDSAALPRTSKSLAATIAARRAQFRAVQGEIGLLANAALHSAEECFSLLESTPNLPDESIVDIAEQLGGLVFSGFVASTPIEWLREYPRYMTAIRLRIERANVNPAKELQKLDSFRPLWLRHFEFHDATAKAVPYNAKALEEHRWLLEELRVSTWAQELRTKSPVSPQRLDVVWAAVPYCI